MYPQIQTPESFLYTPLPIASLATATIINTVLFKRNCQAQGRNQKHLGVGFGVSIDFGRIVNF